MKKKNFWFGFFAPAIIGMCFITPIMAENVDDAPIEMENSPSDASSNENETDLYDFGSETESNEIHLTIVLDSNQVITKTITKNSCESMSTLIDSSLYPSGMSLVGWKINSMDSTMLLIDQTKLFTEDTTLYAVWKKSNSIQVDYGNGVTDIIVPTLQDSMYNLNLIQERNKPEKMMLYGFEDIDTGEQYTKNDYILVDHDVHLKAIWKDSVYITFKYGKNYEFQKTGEYFKDENVFLSSYMSEDNTSGKDIIGWHKNSQNGAILSIGNSSFDSDTILYAAYNNLITITFDWNGGQGSIYGNGNTKDILPNDTFHFSSSYIKERPEGKTLKGWKIVGTDILIKPNGFYKFNTDATIQAVWEDGYSITFNNLNEGWNFDLESIYQYWNFDGMNVVPIDSYQNFSSLKNYLILNSSKTKILTGFRINSENGKFLSLNETFKVNQDMVLYAVWKDAVKIDLQNPDGKNVGTYYIQRGVNAKHTDLYNALFSGHSDDAYTLFQGWFDKDTNEKFSVNTVFTKDTVLVAKYGKNSPVITFDYNDGSNRSFKMTTDSGYLYTNSTSVFNLLHTPQGKIFIGWSTEKKGDVLQQNYNIMYGLNRYFDQDTTLYAQYADTIEVRIHTKNGIKTTLAPKGYYFFLTEDVLNRYQIDGVEYNNMQNLKFDHDIDVYPIEEDFDAYVTVYLFEKGTRYGQWGMVIPTDPIAFKTVTDRYRICTKPGKREQITLIDNMVPKGKKFKKWICENAASSIFEDEFSQTTTILIPDTDVNLIIYPVFEDLELELGQWKSDNYGKWYENIDGSYEKNSFKTINGDMYFFGNNGYMVTGWKKINQNDYFFTSSGVMAKSAWIGNYYVDASGKWIPNKWIKDSNGYWYRYGDGTYPQSGIYRIDGKDYYFNTNGYMQIGWQKINNEYYYFDQFGTMIQNTWIGNYYVTSNGVMATSTWIGNYYVDASGKWIPNKWIKDSNGYWYRYGDGTYPQSGIYQIEGQDYYFNVSGYMQTGWQKINGNDYYFTSSGAMAKDTWVGDYYVDENGIWTPDKWVYTNGKWWYRHQDGSYTTNNFEAINGQTYYFDSDGYMVTGWKSIDDSWYLFDASGTMLKGWQKQGEQWYYLEQSGKMYVGELSLDGEKYNFNSDGVMETGIGSNGWEYDSSGHLIVYWSKQSENPVYHRTQHNIRSYNLVRGTYSQAIANGKTRECKTC